jgi:hypothetical protein
MVQLKVKRVFFKEHYTVGNFFVDGEWICNTLEDKVRELKTWADKIPNETAVPAGTYQVSMEWWEKHLNFYPMLHLVPFFSGILIHSGTKDTDTSGCILLGFNTAIGEVHEGLAMVEKLRQFLKDKTDITITIE